MYKPGQLITKRIYGKNRIFRIARRKDWGLSPCCKCIIPGIGVWTNPMAKHPICKWCIHNLGCDLYLKNP